jgi:hypothetical protein
MDLPLFDEAAETLRALVPTELGSIRVRARRYGLKVWFDAEQPPREHYEAQVIGARHVPEATVLAVEIGFHSEHRGREANDRAIAVLVASEATWRPALGDEAVVGPFLGRPDDWRRVSETWADPDLGDPELGMEIATRLTDYLVALEPIRRSS